MSNYLTFEDPVLLKTVIADFNSANYGWRVSISAYNFLYTKLKENPKIFVGMVFRLKEKDKEDCFVKITNGVHRWVPSTKRGELPYLEYLAVKWENIGNDLLRAVELIEEYRVKTEGEVLETDAKDETKSSN